MTEQQKEHTDDLLIITREELDRVCAQMSAAGYGVSANYVKAMVLSRPAPAAPSELAAIAYQAGIGCGREEGAAQAREDILDKLLEWSITQYEISGVIDTMTLKQKIESLRREVQE